VTAKRAIVAKAKSGRPAKRETNTAVRHDPDYFVFFFGFFPALP